MKSSLRLRQKDRYDEIKWAERYISAERMRKKPPPLSQQEENALVSLLAILNGQSGASSEVIGRLASIRHALVATLHPGQPEPSPTEWDEAEKAANSLLASYYASPKIQRDDNGFAYFGYEIFSPHEIALCQWEQIGIRSLITLARCEILQGLQDCTVCNRTYWPVRVNQKTCRDKTCVRKLSESRPGFSDKRNERERNNRRRAKERDEAQLRVVMQTPSSRTL